MPSQPRTGRPPPVAITATEQAEPRSTVEDWLEALFPRALAVKLVTALGELIGDELQLAELGQGTLWGGAAICHLHPCPPDLSTPDLLMAHTAARLTMSAAAHIPPISSQACDSIYTRVN